MEGMYLRRNRRRKKGGIYEYWTLVESVRTAKGPRQRIVATIGKEPGLDEDSRHGWEDIARLLDGDEGESDGGQGDLFELPRAQKPLWGEANLSGMRVERLREFGKPYVTLALWRRLHLHRFFEEYLPRGKERVGWDQIAFILSSGRFCEQASELALAERWYANTALEDLLEVPTAAVYDNRLYRGLDQLLGLRKVLFAHLHKRYESLCGNRFEFLLYDVTSTCFEGRCERNPQAQRGYSRDQRPDCKQVCIGLVVTPEGLPLAYEVFDGNRADVTTVEDIVEVMERHYGAAERIWVMDRGMVSEDNLDFLRGKQALYIVGTPKADLLRTNCLNKDPQSLWRWYIQLTQAEDAFRCCKSDLGLRPVFHHTENRVQAHILVCFLSLVLWRIFEMWMHACGLGNCARQALVEIERIRSMDVVVPVRHGNEMRVRVVSKPDHLAAELLRKMGLRLPTRPKIVENVVEKNGAK